MSQSTKRILSTIAIVIASIAFGVIISADLGIMRTSNAQTTPEIRTSTGVSAPAVTIPSFADVAARVMPAVVSITTTEVVKTSSMNRMHPFGIDPFDFFPSPQGPRGRGNGNNNDDNNGDD